MAVNATAITQALARFAAFVKQCAGTCACVSSTNHPPQITTSHPDQTVGL